MQLFAILLLSSLFLAARSHVPEDDPLTKEYKSLLRKASHYLANVEAFSRNNEIAKAWAVSEEARANVSAQLQSNDLIVDVRETMRSKKSSGVDISVCEELFDDRFDSLLDEARKRVIEMINRQTGMNLLGLDVLRQGITRLKEEIAEDFRTRAESAHLDVYRTELDDNYRIVVRLAGRTASFAPAALAHLKLHRVTERIRETLVQPVNGCLNGGEAAADEATAGQRFDECED